LNEGRDGLGLIAGGLEGGGELEHLFILPFPGRVDHPRGTG
jgi:hypothetical protein